MNNSPPFKRHSVGRTYPWQVAPQQSLLPFRFNNTKFKSVNYIYNLSKFPATFIPSDNNAFRQSLALIDEIFNPQFKIEEQKTYPLAVDHVLEPLKRGIQEYVKSLRSPA